MQKHSCSMLWLQIIENEKVKINWDPSVMMPLMTQKFMEPVICSFGMLNSKVLFFFTVVRTKTRIPGVRPVTKGYGTRDLQKGSIPEKPGHIDLNSKFQSVVVFSTYTAIKKKEKCHATVEPQFTSVKHVVSCKLLLPTIIYRKFWPVALSSWPKEVAR